MLPCSSYSGTVKQNRSLVLDWTTMPPIRRRGPYKRYLQDLNIPIPRQTVWRRSHERGEDREEQEDPIPSENGGSQHTGPPSLSDPIPSENGGSQYTGPPSLSGDSDNSDIIPENNLVPFHERNYNSDVDGSPYSEDDASVDNNDEMQYGYSSDSNVNDSATDVGSDNGEGNLPLPDDADFQMDGNHPLYEGSPLTRNESDLLIMSFIVRWGLEEKSIDHLLQLINCHLPASVMGSRYLFLKKFPIPEDMKAVYTCPQCSQLLPETEADCECTECGHRDTVEKLKKEGNYFIKLSAGEQIKNILEDSSLYPLLRKQSEESDVVSAKLYERYKRAGVIGINDVTLQWNTDSVSPFKSAKMQVWPLQACINELPYHARRENMILCGLYFGENKPDINTFLTPFVDEIESLHTLGISVKLPGQHVLTTVKVHTFLCSVDSVARPVLQGIMQFNGKYGCSFCLKRSVSITRGRGRARVYPGNMGQLRTEKQHVSALMHLSNYNRTHTRKKSNTHGVKSQSVLLQLSNFDIISSFVPDYLHSVLEGVVKTFLKHWIDSNYKEAAWYLNKRKRTFLSQRLKDILPPVEVTRPPRGLDDLNLFKASEFRHFLLYYSIICLKGILPSHYLKHWFLLVYGMSIYLKDKFSREEAAKAKAAIEKFVSDISIVYPNCLHLYTFNVHLMLHIPQAVKNFGALWASSTFPYEHFNGMIARLMSGTRCRPEQVCRSYLRLRRVSYLGSRLFSLPEFSVSGKKLFDTVMCKYRSSQYSQVFSDEVRLFGAPEDYDFSNNLVEKTAIRRCINQETTGFSCQSFRRLIFRGTVYHASVYESLRVRNNSTVRMKDGKIFSISRILVLRTPINDTSFCILLGEELEVIDEDLCRDNEINISSGELMNVCYSNNRIVCKKLHDVDRKCVRVPYGNAVCVVPLVNTLERD